jgi:hypothetical protein
MESTALSTASLPLALSLPEPHADASSATPEEFRCTACRESTHGVASYLGYALGGTRRIEQTGEAVTDALGYCAAHGAAIARQPEHSAEIVAVFLDATERLARLLADEANQRERIEQVVFAADRGCPACRFADHHDATAVARLGRSVIASSSAAAFAPGETPCFAHFQSLYLSVPSSGRERVLARYRAAFERLLEACMPAPPDENGALDDAWITSQRVEVLLRAVAGEPPEPLSGIAQQPGAAPTDPPDWPALLHDPAACPVCRQARRGALKWFESMRLTVRLGQPLWMTYPACPRHVWLAARRGERRVAAGAAQYAAAAARTSLRERRWPFTPPAVRSPEPTRAARRSRTQKLPSSAGERKREPKARPPSCQGCLRLAVAADAATQQVLTLLDAPENRAAFERGHGLCLKHFAQAYVLLPKGRTRSFLSALQLERLTDLRTQLSASREPSTPAGPTEGPPAWLQAVRRYCGYFPEADEPHGA